MKLTFIFKKDYICMLKYSIGKKACNYVIKSISIFLFKFIILLTLNKE